MRLLTLLLIACLTLGTTSRSAGAKGKVRLFILSGQSNMAGLKPETSFTPALHKAFPDDELIVVQSAQGGQPIRRWLKDWKAPDGVEAKTVKQGDLYEMLLEKVRAASQDKAVDTVSFVWMQGERDAREKLSSVYEKSLIGLIAQLRKDIKRPDMTAVVGRLSDCLQGNAAWDELRGAQEAAVRNDSLAAWVDTDDLNGANDALHYTKEGYDELGRRFAAKTLALLQKEP